jgi:hypothetical protein
MSAVLYRRAFTRASAILGGDGRLARYLHAEQDELRKWKQTARPPVQALQLLAQLFKHRLFNKYKHFAIGRPRTK